MEQNNESATEILTRNQRTRGKASRFLESAAYTLLGITLAIAIPFCVWPCISDFLSKLGGADC